MTLIFRNTRYRSIKKHTSAQCCLPLR